MFFSVQRKLSICGLLRTELQKHFHSAGLFIKKNINKKCSVCKIYIYEPPEKENAQTNYRSDRAELPNAAILPVFQLSLHAFLLVTWIRCVESFKIRRHLSQQKAERTVAQAGWRILRTGWGIAVIEDL